MKGLPFSYCTFSVRYAQGRMQLFSTCAETAYMEARKNTVIFPGSGVSPGEALTAPSSGWLQNVLQVRGDGDKYVTERVS